MYNARLTLGSNAADFWTFGCLSPLWGSGYMQIFSPIAPLERKKWAREVRSSTYSTHSFISSVV